MNGITLDAERGARITIPATALAQAIRNPAKQARLSRLIRQAGTDLLALDGPDATAVGLLLARTGTADIVDAHVVVCAQSRPGCRHNATSAIFSNWILNPG